MTRYKHVLILIILIIPMFVLAPSLVAGPNEVITNRVEVESSRPAQFVGETLRVAVYAEDNVTLPSYASGGVSTAHHLNVIQFLDASGYATTPISTQDIEDGMLMTADFDVFILVNNLPKDEIVNQVLSYWLGGGSILSFDSGLGYMYYHGMIVEGDTGDYALLGVAATPHWGFEYVQDISIQARHSTATDYHVGDSIAINEVTTIHDFMYFDMANGEDFVPILIDASSGMTTVGFALDNTMRKGGRIVQLPGNCSIIPFWESSIIRDSIDWLAPRPKGRILIDLTHDPWISPDAWDPYVEFYLMQNFRNGLVNHSYTFDKLKTELTLTNLEHYDMLIVVLPASNFTAAEVEAVRTWVMDGGGLFVLSDEAGLGSIIGNCDYLISPYDISFNQSSGTTGFDAVVVPPAELHPLHENALYLEIDGGSHLNISGDAYPLWFYNDNIVGAGQEYGEGRIIVSSDGNMVADGLSILEQDNYEYLLNVANWLTAAKANILVYADHGSDLRDPNRVPINGPVSQALNGLELPFYIASDGYYFNKSLFSQDWDMVIFDNIYSITGIYHPHLMDFVEAGGKLIMNTWSINSQIMDYFGIDSIDYISTAPPVLYIWDEAPIFDLPVNYGADNVSSTLDVFGGGGVYAFDFTTFPNATPIAGYSPTDDGRGGIILCGGGRAIMNGPLLSLYAEDTDDSTFSDAYELFTNEIGYLYFDRPTINHPGDVTYEEGETGNVISWTPVADAGSWAYIVRENGSIVGIDLWHGGSIVISVDGINPSITDYELNVYDRLGYSTSDVVLVNVTRAPDIPTTSTTSTTTTDTTTNTTTNTTTTDTGGGTAPDLTLILIVAGATAAVVLVLILVMVLKTKK